MSERGLSQRIGHLATYETVDQMLKVRSTACELAVRHMAGIDDASRLFAYCIFFESYLGRGARRTEKSMRLFDPPSGSPDTPKPVIQLITRDD